MSMVDQVRASARGVAAEARHVRIDEAPLGELASKLMGAVVPSWDHELHFFDGTEKSVMYTLLLDAVNFCFWPTPEYRVDHLGKRYGDEDGYPALAVALKRAFEEGVPLWEPARLASLTESEFRHVLRGEGELALMERRLAHARDLGETLVRRYEGSARGLLEAAKGNAVALVEELASHFVCYADDRPWRGESIQVLKRAQLCVSDLVGSFGGQGLVQLAGAGELTCFADYKLPQLFHADGIFVYAPALDASVRGLKELPEGSEEEVEIRACTIDAVERLKTMLAERGRTLSAREIDWLLWNESILPGRLSVPHHRTITASY